MRTDATANVINPRVTIANGIGRTIIPLIIASNAQRLSPTDNQVSAIALSLRRVWDTHR